MDNKIYQDIIILIYFLIYIPMINVIIEIVISLENLHAQIFLIMMLKNLIFITFFIITCYILFGMSLQANRKYLMLYLYQF
jgi:hypothetical protein